MHRGPLSPRLTNRKAGPKYLVTGFLRCGECDQLMGGSKSARSRKSPYNYICVSGRGCGRCAISGPLVEEAVERLLFSGDGQTRIRLPEPMRQRWQSGDTGFEEKRKVIASVFTHLVVKPGKKGCPTWDHSRVIPVWKWADRIRPPNRRPDGPVVRGSLVGAAGWEYAESPCERDLPVPAPARRQSRRLVAVVSGSLRRGA
ncbi:zinc ribbon domain-containing protein [Streptomyces sp. NBC_01264]|uniref:zinc ribbon domain-containing protein n=1 Tax=Streptomyces sp. NBC_01264 TaxID=2903804 RepID=UPI00338E69F2